MLWRKQPDIIGRYKVIRELGHGGMGVVYQAHDPFIDRLVAIKTLPDSLSPTPKDRNNHQKIFFNEARAAGKLVHPNIVAVHDAMFENDICYLIMEYIEGVTLKEFTSEKSLLPMYDVLKIIFQSARALDYAHQNGVVHRDIKPSNMMISSRREIKITDFGIAHIEGPKANSWKENMAGTVSYMSPEQLQNEILTQQSDLFSLGVVMYELLTGKKPFKAENDYATFFKIANEDPEPINRHRPEVPEVLEQIVKKALEKDLTRRYRTGLEFATDLSASFDNLQLLKEEIDSKEQLNALKKIDFFKDFNISELTEVHRSTQWLKYSAGEVIITEGDIEDCFYIILAGGVKVKKYKRHIAELKPGDCFGEMAYLGNIKRTASIEAVRDTVLMKINTSFIDQTSSNTQLRFYKVFTKTLIERLNRTSELLTKK